MLNKKCYDMFSLKEFVRNAHRKGTEKHWN